MNVNQCPLLAESSRRLTVKERLIIYPFSTRHIVVFVRIFPGRHELSILVMVVRLFSSA